MHVGLVYLLTMNPSNAFGNFLKWRIKHIKQRQFILVLSIIAGALSGLSAVVLMNTLYYTNYFLTNGFTFASGFPVYLLYPAAGIILTVLFVKYMVKEDIPHAMSKVLSAISRNENKRPGWMHAQLTAIFLIAEITGGYELFIPLISASSIAYLISHSYSKHSIYTVQLASRNELITHDKDQATLSFMHVRQLIEKNFLSVTPDASLGELVKVVALSTRNIFPVVDEENNFYGIVTLDSIRGIMFDTSRYESVSVRDLLTITDCSISPDDSMDMLMQLFQKSDRYNVPVLEEGKYLGFISRSTLFSQYRQVLKKFSAE